MDFELNGGSIVVIVAPTTRLGKGNISNLGTDVGAVLGLVLGTEVGIGLGTKLGAVIGLALGLGLGSGLESLLGIETSIYEKLNGLTSGGGARGADGN